MNLIGIHGYAGEGKDTSADILIAKFGFQKRSFATPLYEEVAEAFGVTIDFLANRKTKESPLEPLALHHCKDQVFQNLMTQLSIANGEANPLLQARSPRWIMQHWGTEYRREFSGNRLYWIDKMREFIEESGIQNLVIPDVRPPTEADFVRENGGQMWHMHREFINGVNAHSSEKRLPVLEHDIVIDNNGNLEHLNRNVMAAAHNLNLTASTKYKPSL